jgi:hypothetical protein
MADTEMSPFPTSQHVRQLSLIAHVFFQATNPRKVQLGNLRRPIYRPAVTGVVSYLERFHSSSRSSLHFFVTFEGRTTVSQFFRNSVRKPGFLHERQELNLAVPAAQVCIHKTAIALRPLWRASLPEVEDVARNSRSKLERDLLSTK